MSFFNKDHLILKSIVVTLGILIVLGFVFLISAIAIKFFKIEFTNSSQFSADEQTTVSYPGSEIISIDLEGKNIAIHITHNGKSKIIIYDIKTGELLKEFLPEE
tara:strand:+ start:118 stop:429 length:312 start_codon:yes stop_codon:yes gene_type:complete